MGLTKNRMVSEIGRLCNRRQGYTMDAGRVIFCHIG
jgi:hypothetical protein